jgi:hypothetical protein
MMRRRILGRNEFVDWIEELFGISPDAGNGTLEALIAGAVVAVILGVIFAVRSRNSRVSEKRR